MGNARLSIDILGPRPEEVSLGELADILRGLERAVLAFLKRPLEATGDEEVLSPAEGEAPTTKAPPTVSLVDVRRGSDRLVLSIDEPGSEAIAAFARAIRTGDYAGLPRPAHRELYNLGERVTSNGWGLKFVRSPKLGVREARVTASSPVPQPAAADLVRGSTSIVAEVLRVGGVQPKAQLRIPGREELLYCPVSRDLAQSLGDRLYASVVLHGRAAWNPADWHLEEFTVERIGAYESAPPLEVLDELATAAAGKWEGVDAAAFVRSLREAG